jgi:transposase
LTNSFYLGTIALRHEATARVMEGGAMIPQRNPRDGVRRALTDEAWKQLDPILGQLLSRRGAPPKLELRESLEAVLYLARTGLPWRDLPTTFGGWDAVYQRSRRRQKAGIWQAIWRDRPPSRPSGSSWTVRWCEPTPTPRAAPRRPSDERRAGHGAGSGRRSTRRRATSGRRRA